MKLHCRPTRGKHIKKIAQVEERCYGKYALTASQICHMLQQKFAFGFTAIAGKQLAGHALCIFDPEAFTINLTHVALDPKLDEAFDVDEAIINHAKSLVQRLAFAKLRVYMPANDKDAAVAAQSQGWKQLATTSKVFGAKKGILYEWAWEPFYGPSLN